jgi:NADH:ubiquinone oxidoreductase subunit D
MIEPLKPKQSLKVAELQDGDIICFQRTKAGVEKRAGEKASQEMYVVAVIACGPFTDMSSEVTHLTILRMRVNITISLKTGERLSSIRIPLDVIRRSIPHLIWCLTPR